MSVELLDKTRKIGNLLHNNNSSKVVFNDICKVMREIMSSGVIVISKKGKILGISHSRDEDDLSKVSDMIVDTVGEFLDSKFNDRLLNILSTKENVNLRTLGFEDEYIKDYSAIISPIYIAGRRLGTLFIYRVDKPYDIDDIILTEYGTTVVGLEMTRAVTDEHDEAIRNKQVVQSAISTLSYTERDAIKTILDELNGNEGRLVASKIADRIGITRSVIVNALRKFESAGVIETRSAGVKGTYIRVINDYVFEEIADINNK